MVVAEFQDDLNVGNSLSHTMFDGFDGLLEIERIRFMAGPAAPGTEILQGGTMLNQNTHADINAKNDGA